MTLLWAQVGYAVAAVGYNLANIALRRAGRTPLTRAETTIPLLIFGVYAATLATAPLGWDVFYRAMMIVFVIVLGYGGIVPHIRRGPSSFYRSRGAWMAAIIINALGAALNLVAVFVGAPAA